jgi:hypothetical protein
MLRVREFLSRSISECYSPYDGEPLTAPWESNLEAGDIQELADFALTKFYAPDANQGVGHNWIELDAQLPEEARRALLGLSVAGFDPGRQGAYFQSPSDVAKSATALSGCPHLNFSVIVSYWKNRAVKGLGRTSPSRPGPNNSCMDSSVKQSLP